MLVILTCLYSNYNLLLQFTDVTGSLTHGVAITIREELKGDDAARVRSVIAFHRSRRRAAGIITRWWRVQYSQDLVWSGSSASVISSIFYPPIPKHIQKIGSAAYDAMMDAAAEREICIIEKSYVFTGTPLKEQSLFFCALQNLIDMERQVHLFCSLYNMGKCKQIFTNAFLPYPFQCNLWI